MDEELKNTAKKVIKHIEDKSDLNHCGEIWFVVIDDELRGLLDRLDELSE